MESVSSGSWPPGEHPQHPAPVGIWIAYRLLIGMWPKDGWKENNPHRLASPSELRKREH